MKITLYTHFQSLRCTETLSPPRWNPGKENRGIKRANLPAEPEIESVKKFRFSIQQGKIIGRQIIVNHRLPNYFDLLPDELIGLIFSFVNPCTTRLVCRSWRKITYYHAFYSIVSRLEDYLGKDRCQSVYQRYLSYDPKRVLSDQDKLQLLIQDQRKRLLVLIGEDYAGYLLKQLSPRSGFHETQILAIERWIEDYNLISLLIIHNHSNRELAHKLENQFRLQDFNIAHLATALRQASKVHFYISPIENTIFLTRDLTEIPREITTFTHLKDFYLDNGRMLTLSPVITKIKTLEKLFVCNSQVRAIPQEIGQLTQLRQLFLTDNNLTKLPKEIKQLTKMDILDISHNQFTEVPDEVRFLTELEILVLSGNPLRRLPSFLGQLTKLRELHIAGTQVTFLPTELFEIKTLRIILSVSQLFHFSLSKEACDFLSKNGELVKEKLVPLNG